MKTTLLSFIVLFSLLLSCGGSNTSSSSDLVSPESTNSNTNNNTNDEPILTEKLIGSPFEGFTIGDTFTDCTFIQNEFFTEIVSEEDLPIPIFAAFFTASEEELIQQAIDIVNDSIRPTEEAPIGIEENVFVLIDDWMDHARVIIKVEDTFGEGANITTVGQASTFGYRSPVESRSTSSYITDWEIRIADGIVGDLFKFLIVHEMGHAMGISGHRFIDYEAEGDIFSDLEENSVMAPLIGGTELNDYQYMMRHQAENLKNNFGQTLDFDVGSCGEDGEFGDTE